MSNLGKALVVLAVSVLSGTFSAAATPVVPVGSVLQVGTGEGPQVGVFTDGGFVVVWNGSSPDTLRARFFDAKGVARSGAIQLLRPAGQILDSMAALPTGGFVAVWDQKNPTGTYEVLARVFDRNGGFVSAPFRVHGESPYSRCCALVAPAPGGGFAIEWTAYAGSGIAPTVPDTPKTASIFTQRFDAQGKAIGSRPVQASLENGWAIRPSLVFLPDGGFVTTWSQLASRMTPGAGVLHGRTFNAAGTPVTAEFRLGTKPAGDQSSAALAAGANGQVVAAWTQGATQVYARILKAP